MYSSLIIKNLKVTIYLLLIVFVIIILNSCSEEQIPIENNSSFKYFTILSSKNPIIPKDVIFDITNENNVISGTLLSNTPNLIATFDSDAVDVLIDDVPQVSGETINDFSKQITYTLYNQDGETQTFTVDANIISQNIPHIYFEVEGGEEIITKDYYDATIRIDGGDKYDDFEAPTRVKGRGNSTWAMPKNPIKLNLMTKHRC